LLSFGKNILNDKNALFDNGYIFLYIQYGLIGASLILYFILSICKKIKHDNDIRKTLLVIVYIIYGFTESFTPNIFMNIILLFYSEILFKKRSELIHDK
jgi:O-antigen ligase